MKSLRRLLYIASALALVCSCDKVGTDEPEAPEPDPTYKAVNFFAYNCMDIYYLWIDDIQDAVGNWSNYDDPVEAVKTVRYKDSDGNDIDKWTQVIDDFESFTNSVAGVSTTLGFDFKLYYADASKSRICVVVTFVYEDSPAEKCGLARGDIITEVDGETLTTSNYVALVNERILGGVSVKLTFNTGKSVEMTPVKMYEEPVLEYRTFFGQGKNIAYLAYTSFTLDSYSSLQQAFAYFKQAGTTELILDLRYNTGGYVVTETALASMIAPESDVLAGALFEQDIYNSTLQDKWSESSKTYFQTEYDFTAGSRSYKYSTAGYNPGFKKVYAIVSGETASASESILVGLRPYIEMEIIGKQTYGKYCGGIMYGASEWYEDYRKYIPEETYKTNTQYVDNWGMYVMISRFADKNGNTPCMPAGFVPDYIVDDNPVEAIPLGNPGESMLAYALSRAGYIAPASVVPTSERPSLEPAPFQPSKLSDGTRILTEF